MRTGLEKIRGTVPPAMEDQRSDTEHQMRGQVQRPEPLRLDRVLHLLVGETAAAGAADTVGLAGGLAAVGHDIAQRDGGADERMPGERDGVVPDVHGALPAQADARDDARRQEGETRQRRRQRPQLPDEIRRARGVTPRYPGTLAK